jgi:predicted nuclease of predicted toxin-antitoxin system
VHEQRVVITKDGDFVNTFLLRHMPYKLLLIATGNLGNKELERLFRENLESIVNAFEAYDFVELDTTSIICHS